MSKRRRFALFSEHVRGEPRFHYLQENLGTSATPKWELVTDDDYPRTLNYPTRRHLRKWAEEHGVLVE